MFPLLKIRRAYYLSLMLHRRLHVAECGQTYNDGRLETATDNGETNLNMPDTQEVVGSSPISVASSKP